MSFHLWPQLLACFVSRRPLTTVCLSRRYLGRKRLEKEEPWVPDSKQLVRPGYSYWTLGYMLSLPGARKLLDARPLDNLVPVDEFLPILFDRHPE